MFPLISTPTDTGERAGNDLEEDGCGLDPTFLIVVLVSLFHIGQLYDGIRCSRLKRGFAPPFELLPGATSAATSNAKSGTPSQKWPSWPSPGHFSEFFQWKKLSRTFIWTTLPKTTFHLIHSLTRYRAIRDKKIYKFTYFASRHYLFTNIGTVLKPASKGKQKQSLAVADLSWRSFP